LLFLKLSLNDAILHPHIKNNGSSIVFSPFVLVFFCKYILLFAINIYLFWWSVCVRIATINIRLSIPPTFLSFFVHIILDGKTYHHFYFPSTHCCMCVCVFSSRFFLLTRIYIIYYFLLLTRHLHAWFSLRFNITNIFDCIHYLPL